MNLFYVSQNQTKKEESEGKYLWSPQKDKKGNNNKGYINMSKVKKGDIIIHGFKKHTYAISIAQVDVYDFDRPPELKKDGNVSKWNNEGYKVDSDYILLENHLKMNSDWFKEHYEKDSTFNVKGECKQIYLTNIHIDHAKYIINSILAMPLKADVRIRIKSILTDILQEHNPEYDDSELELINKFVEEISIETEPLTWNGKKEKQEFTITPEAGKQKPKRSAQRAANALKIADYWCEYDKNDRVFTRKNGIRYTEPHHLIPISKYSDFEYSLDVEENITSLCSHCHNLLHYGNPEDKKSILIKLFKDRQAALSKAGLELKNFNELMKYYK